MYMLQLDLIIVIAEVKLLNGSILDVEQFGTLYNYYKSTMYLECR